MTEKPSLFVSVPTGAVDPTFPKSVHAVAVALPFELGINWPARTIGRANAKGLKK